MSLGIIYEGNAKGKRTAKATLMKHDKTEYAQDAESMAKLFAKLATE